MARILFVFALVFATACGDAETKEPNGSTNSNDVDAGEVDAGNGSDAGVNSGDVDAGTELFGTTCDGPGGELLNQDCSMVDQDCEGGSCQKRIILDDMQMPTGFAVICTDETIDSTLAEGDACDPAGEPCPSNMVCKRFSGEAESFCRTWCRMEDAYGCRADQACVPSSDLEPVFGVCAEGCP